MSRAFRDAGRGACPFAGADYHCLDASDGCRASGVRFLSDGRNAFGVRFPSGGRDAFGVRRASCGRTLTD